MISLGWVSLLISIIKIPKANQSLHQFLPFWAGADFHDYHHMAFVGNYSSSFRWWDTLCGTDKAFYAWKSKQRALKDGANAGTGAKKAQ
jgi:sterol desaturase/sphingolipid hydroxylase (fatty acid hydroxylase superfamily)